MGKMFRLAALFFLVISGFFYFYLLLLFFFFLAYNIMMNPINSEILILWNWLNQ